MTKRQKEILKNWYTFVEYIKSVKVNNLNELIELEKVERKGKKRKTFIKSMLVRRYSLMVQIEKSKLEKEI